MFSTAQERLRDAQPRQRFVQLWPQVVVQGAHKRRHPVQRVAHIRLHAEERTRDYREVLGREEHTRPGHQTSTGKLQSLVKLLERLHICRVHALAFQLTIDIQQRAFVTLGARLRREPSIEQMIATQDCTHLKRSEDGAHMDGEDEHQDEDAAHRVILKALSLETERTNNVRCAREAPLVGQRTEELNRSFFVV